MKGYGDEEFIYLLREMQFEARNKDIQKGMVWTSGEGLLFTEREILKKKLWIWLPNDFQILGKEMAKLKYPSEKRPDIIYTNVETTVSITFSRLTLAAGEEKKGCALMRQQLKELYADGSILGGGTVQAKGLELECLIFMSPAWDAMIYNQMFFMPLEGRLMIGNCSCLAQEKDEWEGLFGQMLASIRTADECASLP